MFFYAYRMNVAAFGAEHIKLAQGCKGTVGDGTCYLDEFLKHITPDWTGSTTVGTNLSPDIYTTAGELSAGLTPYEGLIDQHALFPSGPAFDNTPGSRAQLGTVLNALADNLDDCRRQIGDTEDFQNCRRSTEMAHVARSQDNSQRIIEGVDAIIDKATKKAGHPKFVRRSAAPSIQCLFADIFSCAKTVATKTTTLHGVTWDEVDVTAAQHQCRSCAHSLYPAIRNYVINYDTNNKIGKNHARALVAIAAAEARMHASC